MLLFFILGHCYAKPKLPTHHKLRNTLFYIGLSIIIVSFVACVISFYLIIFGIPVFLVGALLVLLSKRPVKTKLLATIVPLVLYIPATILFLYAYNYSVPKTLLIPQNFEGPLRIVYKEKCGSPYQEIEGETTLVFPENGILILNEDFDRHINYEYYFVDKAGKRTKIFYELTGFSKSTKHLPCIVSSGSGTMGQSQAMEDTSGNSKEEYLASEGPKEIKYTEFYVYNNDTINTTDEDNISALMVKAVEECREKK